MFFGLARQGRPDALLCKWQTEGETKVIGRDKSCAIVLDAMAPGVSRRHVSLTLRQDKIVMLDSSSYGTFVDEERVHQRERILDGGEVIRVGSEMFVLSTTTPTPSNAKNVSSFPHKRKAVPTSAIPAKRVLLLDDSETLNEERSRVTSASVVAQDSIIDLDTESPEERGEEEIEVLEVEGPGAGNTCGSSAWDHIFQRPSARPARPFPSLSSFTRDTASQFEVPRSNARVGERKRSLFFSKSPRKKPAASSPPPVPRVLSSPQKMRPSRSWKVKKFMDTVETVASAEESFSSSAPPVYDLSHFLVPNDIEDGECLPPPDLVLPPEIRKSMVVLADVMRKSSPPPATTHFAAGDRPNFKRFKKARQGRFYLEAAGETAPPTIAGSSDLVDFRKIAS